MATLITIADQVFDADDPCAVASALRMVELKLAAGEAVVRARFGEDDVQFSPANLTRLNALIERYEGLCAVKNGERRRHARRIRYVPR